MVDFPIFCHEILWIAYWLLKRKFCACQRQPSRDGQRRLKKPLLRLGAAGVRVKIWEPPKKYGGNVENPEKETTSWGSLSVVMVNILGPKNWKVHWHDGPKICKQGCSSDSGEGHGMTWLCSKCDVQNIQSKGHLRPILSLKTQKLYEFLHSNPQRKLDTMI